ncbi:carboxypeptidase-like regulatory domain-containing protein [Bacteroidota bacterium]
MRKRILFVLMLLGANILNAQELTQTVRGKVIDNDTQMPLIGATVVRLGTEITTGTSTDVNGEFELKNVPVGRQNLQVSYLGYQPYVVNELLVSSGKETVLTVGLTESVNKIEEVVVKAQIRKDQALNSMTSISARVFSVEEAKRYAGGFDDPLRLASAFAGVSGPEIESNGISVRGNAPSMVQYRIEGVEVQNANHFEGGDLLGGGFVSLFSSHLLANSDFLTGAFPAQYGNALSATFDMKLRNGNNQNYEHAIQVGVMGIDVASEGPFKKGGNASYLFNYRYSTFGLLTAFLPEGEGLPIYQDLNFKLNFPTKIGVFSVWGAGAIDSFDRTAEEDSTEWNMKGKRMENNADFNIAMGGLTHKYILKNQAYINTSVVYTYDWKKDNAKWLHDDLNLYDLGASENVNNTFTIATFLNKKFGARHTNRTGVNYKLISFNYDQMGAPKRLDPMVRVADIEGNTALIQAYSQSKFSVTDNFIINAGLNFQMLTLNNKYNIEPRLGMKYKTSDKLSISAAYGYHSKMQVLNHYFIQDENGNTPNEDLDFTKAHHFVLGFDYKLGENTRLKIEPYYQILSEIPVIKDSSFAVINLQDAHGFDEVMENGGTGINYGVEFTLEKFLDRGFYYLVTASIYDSKYEGGDGVERNTAFNGNYVGNILLGKEWTIGKSKNNRLGINGRYYFNGGARQSPINYAQSDLEQEVVYDDSRLFEEKAPNTSRLDLTLSFSRNRPKYTSTLSVQMLNVLGSVITYKQNYDFVKNEVVEFEGKSNMPNVSWRIDF